jgi:elongation factor 3
MISESLLESLFAADTTEKVHDVAKLIATEMKDSINLDGSNSLVFERLSDGLLDKKSGFSRESAVIAYMHLIQQCQLSALPYILKVLPFIFEMEKGDKGQVVREACQDLLEEVVKIVPAVSFKLFLMELIFNVLDNGKWPAKISAVSFLARLVKKGDPILCQEVSTSLSEIIPKVSNCMHDTKQEVSNAAIQAMLEIVQVVGNPDIENALPDLVQCMAHPLEVEACIEKLSKTTFVAEVTSPSLAVMV